MVYRVYDGTMTSPAYEFNTLEETKAYLQLYSLTVTRITTANDAFLVQVQAMPEEDVWTVNGRVR